jgi:hypothetical protein
MLLPYDLGADQHAARSKSDAVTAGASSLELGALKT